MVRTKSRALIARNLKAGNDGLDPPPFAMPEALKWLSCDVCGRNPITAWHFKPTGAGAKNFDVCYPCVATGAADHLKPLYFMGRAVVSAPVVEEPELAETSSDEEQGVLDPDSIRYRHRETVEASAKDKKGKAPPPAPKPRAVAARRAAPAPKRTGAAGKRKAAVRSQAQSSSSSSSSSSDTSDDNDAVHSDDEDLTLLHGTGEKMTPVASPAAGASKIAARGRGRGGRGRGGLGRGSDTKPGADEEESMPTVLVEPAVIQPPAAAPDAMQRRTKSFAAGADATALAAELSMAMANALSLQSAAPVAPADAPTVTPVAKESAVQDPPRAQEADEDPTAALPKASRGGRGRGGARNQADEGARRGGNAAAAPQKAARTETTATASDVASTQQEISAAQNIAARGATPPAQSPQSSTQVSSPTSATSKAPAVEPTTIEVTPVVHFFRDMACGSVPQGSVDPTDAALQISVHETPLQVGDSCEVLHVGGARHQVMSNYGRIASVSVVPMLSSEGLWVSVLSKGAVMWYVLLWHLPLSEDGGSNGVLGKAELKGIIIVGNDPVFGFEWVPLPIHTSDRLGFASVLKSGVIMSGSIPREFPETKTFANRICGLTALGSKELEPVSLRWVAHPRELSRCYVAVVHRCSTVIIFSIVYPDKQDAGLILAPRQRFPPTRGAVMRPLNVLAPIAVGARANGDTFISVAHESLIITIESGLVVHSCASLETTVTAVSATANGLYCALENGRTCYVRSNGRDKRVDELTMPVFATGVTARSNDVLIGTASGTVSRWSPPARPVGLASIEVRSVAAGSLAVAVNPCPAADTDVVRAVPAPSAAAAIRYAYHPVAGSKLARYCIAWHGASGLSFLVDCPPSRPSQ